MRLNKKRWIGAALLVFASGSALWAAGRAKAPPKPEWIMVESTDMEIKAHSPGPGLLEFQIAKQHKPHRDHVYWWEVTVGQTGPDGYVTVWKHTYDDVLHQMQGRKGKVSNYLLAPSRVPFLLPAGTYHVHAALHEDSARRNFEGELIEMSSIVHGETGPSVVVQ